jgi:hypothetical protein
MIYPRKVVEDRLELPKPTDVNITIEDKIGRASPGDRERLTRRVLNEAILECSGVRKKPR